ncbi:MAG: hypothetical protein ACRCR2_08010 [Fusobacteriaceae bacterium]
MKELTQEQKDLIIAEASHRAEASRPKSYIFVPTTEVDPMLISAQEEVDRLTKLIPENIKETFRIEFNPNPHSDKVTIIRKRDLPHTMILPTDKVKSNKKGIIITGIMNHYIGQGIIPSDQMQNLMDILLEANPFAIIDSKPAKKKRSSSKSDKVKKPREPKAKDINKQDIVNTSGVNIIKLSTICEELNLDPKKARIKLRKHFNKPTEGWEWSSDKVEDIKKFLKG